jgi:hypothetical protein
MIRLNWTIWEAILFLQFCVVAQLAIIKKYLAKIGEIQNMKTQKS